MELSEYRIQVSNLRHALGQARAVCMAFGNEYVDSDNKHVIALLIEDNPEKYEYLFAALASELHEAYQLAARLDDAGIEQK